MKLSTEHLWHCLAEIQEKLPFLADFDAAFPEAEIYLVGGAVRDILLGHDTKDYDFLVRGVSSDQLAKCLRRNGKVSWVGKNFGVYKFYPDSSPFEEAIDVALPRTEASFTQGGGYRDFNIISDSNLPVETDLRRRDFTINAMAADLKKRKLIDPFNGMNDLRQGLLRAVGDPAHRFSEDSSRLLRGLRFAAQLGFSLEAESWMALKEKIPALNAKRPDGSFVVPRETVAREFIKGMVSDPVRSYDLWHESGAFSALIPELLEMKGCPQPKNYHSEGDVWTHTRLALSQLKTASFQQTFGEKYDAEVALAVLLHDIAKPVTIQTPEKDGVDRIRFNGHDSIGAEMARKIAVRLKLSSFPKGSRYYVDESNLAWLIQKHLILVHGRIEEMRASTIERIFLNPKYPGDKLLQLIYCDGMATVPQKNEDGKVLHYFQIKERIDQIKSLFAERAKVPPPLLSGNKVMEILRISPGPMIGKYLALVREEQLSGRLSTQDAALHFLNHHKEKSFPDP